MINDVDEKELEEALAKAYLLADHAEVAASKAPPELAAALRRSAAAMVSNIEKALETLRTLTRGVGVR